VDSLLEVGDQTLNDIGAQGGDVALLRRQTPGQPLHSRGVDVGEGVRLLPLGVSGDQAGHGKGGRAPERLESDVADHAFSDPGGEQDLVATDGVADERPDVGVLDLPGVAGIFVAPLRQC
jgi:hypothetical protein